MFILSCEKCLFHITKYYYSLVKSKVTQISQKSSQAIANIEILQPIYPKLFLFGLTYLILVRLFDRNCKNNL